MENYGVKSDSLLVNSQGLMFNNNAKKYLTLYSKPFFILAMFFITLTILSMQITQADIISLNSGGTQEIAITPDKYVEGFFSGIPETVAETPTPTPTPSPGGGAGGGGVQVPVTNIAVSPAEFDINLIINTTTQRTIRVTNLGSSQVTVVVSQSSLDNHIILTNNSLLIPAGGSVDLDVIFIALDQPGIFTGKIVIGGKEILVALNVKTKLLLFDSNIIVLNRDLTVAQGGELRTLVTIIPLGDPERLDVTLNFVIKDYNNKVYLTKSETLLVDKLTELRRNFDTGPLNPGDYVVGLELVYPNGVAPSSAYFKVVERTPLNILGRIILFLVIMILVIAILILIIIIWRRRKKKKEETSSGTEI